MPLHKRSLLHLKPTYELVMSKVLLSLGQAAAIVGIPLYFIHLGLTDSQIGLLTGIISLIVAVLCLYLPPILEKFNQRGLLIGSAIAASVCLIMFGYSQNASSTVILLLLAQIALQVNSSALCVLFKDSTRSLKEFTKGTGFLGSFNNLGWFVGPLLGGFALSVASFKGLFILAGSFILLGGIYVWLFPFKTVVKQRLQLDKKVKANLRFYLANPQLRIAYLQKFGIDLWWGFVWTFVPIFMLRAGYSAALIGLFIALTQLPLFLFEFKTVGAVARYGYKRIFIFSYASLVIISLLSFVAFPSHFIVALGLILLGSLAMSFLEPISDLFFFSKVSLLEEEKAYPIYATSSPVGGIIGKIAPALVLVALYDQATFILIGLLMCFITYRALAIKD